MPTIYPIGAVPKQGDFNVVYGSSYKWDPVLKKYVTVYTQPYIYTSTGAAPDNLPNYVYDNKGVIKPTAPEGNVTATGITGGTLDNSNSSSPINGSEKSERLVGSNGNDNINGLGGDDTIVGGKGADTLTGGTGKDVFQFKLGDSGQSSGFDNILDYSKGKSGDVIDFDVSLVVGGSNAQATATMASINKTTGVATFAAGSGNTLSDALGDIAASFSKAKDLAGQFALFKYGLDHYIFVSDGNAGVTSNDVVVKLTGVSTVNEIDLTGGNLIIIR